MKLLGKNLSPTRFDNPRCARALLLCKSSTYTQKLGHTIIEFMNHSSYPKNPLKCMVNYFAIR